MPDGYISFKTNAGTHVSTKKYKNHAEAAKWVAAELKAQNLKASDIKGKPAYPVDENGK